MGLQRTYGLMLVALLLSGCAYGVVTKPDGTRIECHAFGHSGCRACEYKFRPGMDTVKGARPDKFCAEIHGGFLSKGITGVFEAAVTAVAGWYAAAIAGS